MKINNVNKKLMEIAMSNDYIEILTLANDVYKLDINLFLDNFDFIYKQLKGLLISSTIKLSDYDRVFLLFKNIFINVEPKYIFDFINEYMEINKTIPFKSDIFNILLTFKLDYNFLIRYNYLFYCLPKELLYFVFTDNIFDEDALQNRINILNTVIDIENINVFRLNSYQFKKEINIFSRYIPLNIYDRIEKTIEYCPIWDIKLNNFFNSDYILDSGKNLGRYDISKYIGKEFCIDEMLKKDNKNVLSISKIREIVFKEDSLILKSNNKDMEISYLKFDMNTQYFLERFLSNFKNINFIIDLQNYQETGSISNSNLQQIQENIIKNSMNIDFISTLLLYKSNLKKKVFMKSLEIKIDNLIFKINTNMVNNFNFEIIRDIPIKFFQKLIEESNLNFNDYKKIFKNINNKYYKSNFNNLLINQLILIRKQIKNKKLSLSEFNSLCILIKSNLLKSNINKNILSDLEYKFKV